MEPGIDFSAVPGKVFWRSFGLKGFLVNFFGRVLDISVGPSTCWLVLGGGGQFFKFFRFFQVVTWFFLVGFLGVLVVF